MTFEDYQDDFVRTLARNPYEWMNRVIEDSSEADLLHATMGLVTETGELMDTLKKRYIYGKELDKINIREELGDILFYLTQAASSQGYSLKDILEVNVRKLNKRYEGKFSGDAANVRNLEAERKELEA